jgi:MFS family permease
MNKKHIKIVIYAIGSLIMAAHGINGAIAGMVREFGVDKSHLVQLTISMPPLFIMAASLIGGVLGAKFSRKKIILAGTAFAFIGGILPTILNGIIPVLAARSLMGIGTGLCIPLATSLAADFFEGPERSHILGVQFAFAAIGGVFSGLAGGLLSVFGWRYVYLIYLAVIPVFILVWKYLSYDTDIQFDNQQKRKTSLSINRMMILIALAYFITNTAKFVHSTTISLFLNSEKLAGPSMAGLLSSIYTFTGFIGGFIYGWAFKKLNHYVLTLSLAVTGIGMFLVFNADSIWPIILAAIIEGVALSLLTPRFNEMMLNAAPPGGVILGLSIAQAANNLGQFSSPVVFNGLGILLGMTSYRSKFLLAAAALGGMTIFSLVLNLCNKKKCNYSVACGG